MEYDPLLLGWLLSFGLAAFYMLAPFVLAFLGVRRGRTKPPMGRWRYVAIALVVLAIDFILWASQYSRFITIPYLGLMIAFSLQFAKVYILAWVSARRLLEVGRPTKWAIAMGIPLLPLQCLLALIFTALPPRAVKAPAQA